MHNGTPATTTSSQINLAVVLCPRIYLIFMPVKNSAASNIFLASAKPPAARTNVTHVSATDRNFNPAAAPFLGGAHALNSFFL